MIQQGDIFLADLNPVKGHEQSGYRPVLVMQNNILNTNLNTVLIAPITSNLQAKGKLTTFFLPQKLSKLHYDSVVLFFQMRTIDTSRLEKLLTHISHEEFIFIKDQLRFIF